MRTLNLILTLGLALFFSIGAFAQNLVQNDEVAQSESCCAMKDAKNHSAKDGCCCCTGDSCDTKIKENQKNHSARDGCCCSTGDSCNMKMKESMKNHSAQDGCCCCTTDSCDMKMKESMKDMKHQHKE